MPTSTLLRWSERLRRIDNGPDCDFSYYSWEHCPDDADYVVACRDYAVDVRGIGLRHRLALFLEVLWLYKHKVLRGYKSRYVFGSLYKLVAK